MLALTLVSEAGGKLSRPLAGAPRLQIFLSSTMKCDVKVFLFYRSGRRGIQLTPLCGFDAFRINCIVECSAFIQALRVRFIIYEFKNRTENFTLSLLHEGSST